jgi:hypothetical protein
MRSWTFAILSSAALTLSTAPADAAWKTYVSKELGFAFMAPGEIKGELGTSRGAIAGPRQTFVFKATEDNIEYRVTVQNFPQAQAEGASLLGERTYMFQDGKNVLMDTFGRVEPGRDSVYGRKIVIDLPDKKGRTTGAFYFTKGRLISLEATVLPANGDYESPDPGRFIDSIVFVLSRAEQEGAVELKVPTVE